MADEQKRGVHDGVNHVANNINRLQEGMMKKGGINSQSITSRPAPPKGMKTSVSSTSSNKGNSGSKSK